MDPNLYYVKEEGPSYIKLGNIFLTDKQEIQNLFFKGPEILMVQRETGMYTKLHGMRV